MPRIVKLFDLAWVKLRQFDLNLFALQFEDYVRISELADQLPALAARGQNRMLVAVHDDYGVNPTFAV